MKTIEEFPGEELGLRERLPAMREQTRESLIRWGEVQPGAMPWLLKRTAAYWEKFGKASVDIFATQRVIDATAALDLLKWRIEAIDDKEAVGHLEEVKGPKEEVAA